MGWVFDGKSGGQARDFVREGNVDVYMFKPDPDRVRLIIEPIDYEAVARERKITAEQTEELVRTEIMFKQWVQPISLWQHNIPEIQGKRFYSTVACQGRGCPFCEQNQKEKDNGVSENKLLSFPVSKRFLIPIWSYRLNMILILKQTQEFFEDIERYVSKHGPDVDFEFSKSGRGKFGTKYKAIFVGAAELSLDALRKKKIKWMSPDKISLREEQDVIDKKLGKVPAFEPPTEEGQGEDQGEEQVSEEHAQAEAISPAASPKAQKVGAAPAKGRASGADRPGDFIISFGNHKGQTIADVAKADPAYVKFLADRGSGIVQAKVKEYLASNK